MPLNESTVEDTTLDWFEALGYAVAHGPHLALGEIEAERNSFSDVVLVDRLRAAIQKLNPTMPDETRKAALRKVLREDLSLVAISSMA